ncbi:hypothetical protein BGW38_002924 [Lunasporangiospora selenospora]|uniref:SPIN90/Ldb17 leucine-rich domain-containing protein n=1 Tax=Lunasporangiospora selenospora TaxID=979761 RepID=A0A9P6KD29_9FUNG|nr:hypothetical protein BGW38_002924 [Lunasporangiospora selenospora]
MTGTRIQPLIIELMYEVCKLQRLERDKLDLVEDTTSDAEETLNCDAVKLVLALNEQFMLHMSSPMNNLQYNVEREFRGNLVLSVLAARQGHINVFSQSLIFMLNRAGLFEFFYTNDLHVLVDVVIRELWDLSEEESSLRHAYLRVLGPLLTNTQLKRASYKRAEIVRLLRDLGGGDLDSTLRRQLQEQQIRELFLEKERARTVKITFRERESSLSLGDRWGDRSGCASPVLSSAMGPKRSHRKSLLSGNSVSSNSLQVPGHEEQKEAYQQHFIQQSLDALLGNNDPGPLQLTTEPNKWCDQQRPASPTTQRLVERILQEWLDKEMKNGGGTAAHQPEYTMTELISDNMSKLSVEDAENLEELIESARYGELEELQAVVQTSLPTDTLCALSGWKYVVEFLISTISPEAINIQNEQGNTALHWAAANGHLKVVESLIKKGKADYKIKNGMGHSAMFEAELLERDQVVAWMLINTEPEEDLQQVDDDDDDEEDDDEEEEEEEEEEQPSKAVGSSTA